MATNKKISPTKNISKINSLLDIIIIILTFTAVVLGMIIVERKYPQVTLLPNITIPMPKLSTSVKTSPAPVVGNVKSVSDLNDFGPNTMKDNWEVIQSASVQTNTITFSDCNATPLIARVTQGETITLKNNDSEEHTIFIDDKHTYPLEPNSSIAMTVDLENQGLYSYSCDGQSSSPRSGGILFVTL